MESYSSQMYRLATYIEKVDKRFMQCYKDKIDMLSKPIPLTGILTLAGITGVLLAHFTDLLEYLTMIFAFIIMVLLLIHKHYYPESYIFPQGRRKLLMSYIFALLIISI